MFVVEDDSTPVVEGRETICVESPFHLYPLVSAWCLELKCTEDVIPICSQGEVPQSQTR